MRTAGGQCRFGGSAASVAMAWRWSPGSAGDGRQDLGIVAAARRGHGGNSVRRPSGGVGVGRLRG
jgi:hypothetical protein